MRITRIGEFLLSSLVMILIIIIAGLWAYGAWLEHYA